MEGPVSSFSYNEEVLTRRYEAKISSQMARLGGSHDWDRVAFTMSEVGQRAKAVLTSSL
jgi:valyl-tRNA synthetase